MTIVFLILEYVKRTVSVHWQMGQFALGEKPYQKANF